MKYRLIITTDVKGLDSVVSQRLPALVPYGQTPSTCQFTCTDTTPLPDTLRTLIDGWIEEEIILGYSCTKEEE